jgi:polyisoprenyl-teichoic acid--peptidoglycan teichoic acid transferase
MLKSFVDVRDAPVRQVELENTFEDSYVVSTQDQIDAAVDQFLGKDIDEEPVPAEEPEEEPPPEEKKKKKPDEPSGPDLIDASGTGQQYAAAFEKYLKHRKAHLPVFYPTQIVANVNTAITPESRAFSLAGPENKETYRGYKFVVAYQEPGFLSYYGVSGVNWTDPPILNNPSEIRRIDGRDYMLFWEADRLRLVGWKTDNGAYWVINTLTHALSEDEMLAVATSTREFDG